jgi:macrocin-O-methyltransferase TylF-like protien
MFQVLKEKVKRRIRYHLDRQLFEATKDIEFARQFLAAQESAEFADQHMRMAKSYPDKFALLKAAIQQVEIPGLYCEFGVYRGATLNFIASLVKGEVHGFDSFEGLPEDWKQGHEKGTFAVDVLPQLGDNVRLHKGWFENTIPAFRAQHPEPIAFLHLDADLYSSTRTVFDLLGDAIVAHTVIAFDEFFNYPGWCEGEYKAFMEFCQERGVTVHYLGFARRDEQVAAKIARIAPVSEGAALKRKAA